MLTCPGFSLHCTSCLQRGHGPQGEWEARTSPAASELMGGRQSPAVLSLSGVSTLSQELASPDALPGSLVTCLGEME